MMGKAMRSWLFLVFCLSSAVFAADPVVSNVRASQRTGTKLVDIYYNVSDADDDEVEISLAIKDGDSVVSSPSLSAFQMWLKLSRLPSSLRAKS